MLQGGVSIESSVWNSYFNDHTPVFQEQTKRFFVELASAEGLMVWLSDVVLRELTKAPVDRQRLLFDLIREVRPLELVLDEESARLAQQYVRHGVLSPAHITDAQHVALATVTRVGTVVSWNYRHLVNDRRRDAFNGVNALLGYGAVKISAPPEVFGDELGSADE